MKMRAVNHLTAAVIALVNILTFIAVLTGQHTLFGIVAASISLAVGLGMYLRVVIGTAALQMAEKNEEKLIYMAIAQKKDNAVVREYAEWVRKGDMDFMGAKIVDLIKAKNDQEEFTGYLLLAVATESVYAQIKNKLGDATVLDYWPIERDEWAKAILSDMLEEEPEPVDDGPIEELKG